MEQVTYFTTFLTEKVNLPEYKLDFLDERVDRLFEALKKASLGTRVLGMKKQGSWAQRTIINPKENEEFDADFMVELDEKDGWTPSDYQGPVFTALRDYCEAQQMKTPPEAKNRCVRVSYANFMHVDVVPYVSRANQGECILNTDTDAWEDTDPDGFTKWMKDKDDITGGNMRRVLRILKYLRDHRDYYGDTKSIILTTIVGGVISKAKVRNDPAYYGNVPTTLKHIVNDLVDWVRDQTVRPEIPDPSRADSTFTHRWPQAEYDSFRQDIQIVADLVNDAYNCKTKWSDSTAKWQKLFGNEFGPSDSTTDSKFVPTGDAAAVSTASTTTGRTGRAG
jgi:hypothetical protein